MDVIPQYIRLRWYDTISGIVRITTLNNATLMYLSNEEVLGEVIYSDGKRPDSFVSAQGYASGRVSYEPEQLKFTVTIPLHRSIVASQTFAKLKWIESVQGAGYRLHAALLKGYRQYDDQDDTFDEVMISWPSAVIIYDDPSWERVFRGFGMVLGAKFEITIQKSVQFALPPDPGDGGGTGGGGEPGGN